MAKLNRKLGVSGGQTFQESPALTLMDSPVFRVRLGQGRSQAAPKVRGFIGRIKALVRQHGGSATSRRYRAQFGVGGSAAARLPVRSHPQRVIIKARVVKHSKFAGAKGGAAGALRKHLEYLGRAGVAEHEGRGVVFNQDEDLTPTMLAAFRDELVGDRHHFRFIVSPEHGAKLDLQSFARELVSEMQTDLGTRLNWIGVAHYDTDDPHVHLLIQGKDERGGDLIINRNYLSHGMRLQAMELATRRLGHRLEEDIEKGLKRELKADRLTPKDLEISAQAALHPDGLVSALRGKDGTLGSESERVRTLSRLAHLESLGLAREIAPGVWQPQVDLVAQLRSLSTRGDIIKRMHERMRGGSPAMHTAILTRESPPTEPVIGRIYSQGISDELSDDQYLLVEAQDGKAYYVNLSAARHAAGLEFHLGSIVRIVPSAARERGTVMRIEGMSRENLDTQIKQNGVTWLDREIATGANLSARLRVGASRFEGQHHQALRARLEHLKSLGLTADGEGETRVKNGFLDELYVREINDAHQRLQARYGELAPVQPGQQRVGRMADIEHLPSGPHAVIESQGGYSLVPASPAILRHVGRNIRISIGRARAGEGVTPTHEQWAIRYRVLDLKRSLKMGL
jgi:type IV secretory pathway VirD2 relaxase